MRSRTGWPTCTRSFTWAGDVARGLAVLAPVLAAERLRRYAPLHAAHAELLRLAGRVEEAREAWERAVVAATNSRQRDELRRRAGNVGG